MYFRCILATIVSVCVVVAIVVVGSEPTSVDLCSWQSRTHPDPLKGNQGNSSHDTYWFTHTSDVDKESQKHHFIFAIKNKHSVNYLPAEWLRGDSQVQVAFSRIIPEGCGANDFETFLSFQEDPKAIINYGPLKQNKKNAPLYVEVEPHKTDAGQRGPQLKSRIIADLHEVGQDKHRLHLEFTTELEGREFTYTVTNRGTKNEVFMIPAFSIAWDKVGKVTKLDFRSRWMTQDGVFAARANREPERHIVRMAAPTGFREKLVQVEVLSRERKPMATGQITVYLPVLKD